MIWAFNVLIFNVCPCLFPGHPSCTADVIPRLEREGKLWVVRTAPQSQSSSGESRATQSVLLITSTAVMLVSVTRHLHRQDAGLRQCPVCGPLQPSWPHSHSLSCSITISPPLEVILANVCQISSVLCSEPLLASYLIQSKIQVFQVAFPILRGCCALSPIPL